MNALMRAANPGNVASTTVVLRAAHRRDLPLSRRSASKREVRASGRANTRGELHGLFYILRSRQGKTPPSIVLLDAHGQE